MNALLCFARKGEKNHKHGVQFSDRNQPNIFGRCSNNSNGSWQLWGICYVFCSHLILKTSYKQDTNFLFSDKLSEDQRNEVSPACVPQWLSADLWGLRGKYWDFQSHLQIVVSFREAHSTSPAPLLDSLVDVAEIMLHAHNISFQSFISQDPL